MTFWETVVAVFAGFAFLVYLIMLLVMALIDYMDDHVAARSKHEHLYRGTGGPCTVCGRGIYVERAEQRRASREGE